MNVQEPFWKKNRRKTEQVNSFEKELNLWKLKNHNKRRSISSRKINIYNDIQNISINIKNQNKNLKIKPLSSKKVSYYNIDNNKLINCNNNIYKRSSYDVFNSKAKQLFKKYNLKSNENLIKTRKSRNSFNLFSHSTILNLNTLQNNIKSIINKMKNEIEKKNHDMTKSISPRIIRNKRTSSPNFKINFDENKVNKHKSKNIKASFIEEYHINKLNNSFDKKYNIKRSLSFNYSEQEKKKIFRKIKKNHIKYIFTKNFNIYNSNTFDNDSDNDEHLKGFAILPTSNYIFIFDLLLTIANLYTFIFFPLNIAHNKDIRNKESIIKEIIHYLIDLIYMWFYNKLF